MRNRHIKKSLGMMNLELKLIEDIIDDVCDKKDITYYDDEVCEINNQISIIKHALSMLELELKYNKIGL